MCVGMSRMGSNWRHVTLPILLETLILRQAPKIFTIHIPPLFDSVTSPVGKRNKFSGLGKIGRCSHTAVRYLELSD